jgi:hypothetical protein
VIEVYDGLAYYRCADDPDSAHLIGDIDDVKTLVSELEERIASGQFCKLCPDCSGSGYRRGAIPRVYKANAEGRVISGPHDPGCETCGGNLTNKGSGRAA